MNITKFLRNKTIKNAGWLMAGKVVHMILSFVIGLISARYLGPSNYGLINYASAYVTFFTSVCTLGINSIIVKNFVDKPDEEGESLGTSIVLRLVSSFLSVGVISFIVRMIDGNEPVTLVVVTLYSISLVFTSFDIFRQWFQSKLLSKYYAVATLVSYLIASGYKLYLLITGKSVEWFAVSNSIDHLIVALLLYAFYKKCNGPKLSFSRKKAKELLSVSCSYILAGLMTSIYASTDKLMLKQLMSESSVGYYALAVSISSMWTFVLSALIESISPSIMQCHNTDKKKYEILNKRLYALVFYFSLFASVVICLIAPLFIKIVYGEDYLPAVSSLRIVVWFVAFSYLGVARNVWVVCEKKQRYLKYLYLGSAVSNIILNVIMIPILGEKGAAIASLLTQISTVFVFPCFIKEMRPNVKMMTEAVLLKGVFQKTQNNK